MPHGASAMEQHLHHLPDIREKLRRVLVGIQEAAVASEDDGALLGVAESLALASGRLFEVDRLRPPRVEAQARMQEAWETLRVARAKLVEVDPGQLVPQCQVLSEVLHALEESAGGHGPEPAGRKDRKGLVLVPEEELAASEQAQAAAAPARDRRGAERRLLEVEIGLTSESTFYTGLTMDLSSGGVFVATYDLLPVGTSVNLEFDLPTGRRVKVDGEVKWLRKSSTADLIPGMGVAFRSLRTEDVRTIEAFCRQRPPIYYEVD